METLAESDRKPQFIALFSQLKADVPLRLTRNREPLPVRRAKGLGQQPLARSDLGRQMGVGHGAIYS